MDSHLVVAVAYDGLCTFELGCVVEIFGLARPELEVPWYGFAVAAAEPGPLRAVGGITLAAPHDLSILDRAGTVVVPGWRNPAEDPPLALTTAIARTHDRGARLVSICSGVFVLAAAGVLDGRRATTHWRYAEALARRYPKLRVDPDVLYVDDGMVLTSAGSAAGLDLCLHIVRRDHGAEVANAVARRLVVAPHREGGQRQFVAAPLASGSDGGRFARLLDQIREELDTAHNVAGLARRAGMSERSFHRRFRDATGLTPHDWLLRQRIRRAQDLLESGRLSVEEVATRCGFGAAETLRHHFRRLVGTSPSRYRRRFARA